MTTSKSLLRPPEPVCENCGATLTGRFCAACGQDSRPAGGRATGVLRGLADVASLDLRTPRSLLALMAPGRLPRRYAEGHRIPYVPPLRLAVSLSIILLVAVTLRFPEAPAPTVDTELIEDIAYVAQERATVLTVGQLLALPLLVPLLRLLYGRGRDRRVGKRHLTFALAFHAAVCMTGIMIVGASLIASGDGLAYLALLLIAYVFGPYLVLAVRRFYKVGWMRTLLTWPILVTGYALLNAVVFGVTLVLPG